MRTGSRFSQPICCQCEPNHEGAHCDARGGREPRLGLPLAVGSVEGVAWAEPSTVEANPNHQPRPCGAVRSRRRFSPIRTQRQAHLDSASAWRRTGVVGG